MKRCPDEGIAAAVREYCLRCSGGSRREVECCMLRDCPLYPYRSLKAAGLVPQKAKPEQLQGQIELSDILH